MHGRVHHQGPTYTAISRFRSSISKKPPIAALSTHHRTGTLLFQYIMGEVSRNLGMDFDRLEDQIDLSCPDASTTAMYMTYENTSNRLMVGMHGYKEICPRGPQPGAYCGDFDVECWMQACRLETPSSGVGW